MTKELAINALITFGIVVVAIVVTEHFVMPMLPAKKA